MRDPRSAGTTERAGALRWTSRLLVAAGLGALSWCAFVMVDARVYQRSAWQALDAAPRGIAPPRPSVAPGDLRPRMASDPAPGTPIGALSIPRLQLSVVVLHGTDALTLRRGLGHVEGTAWPGDAGNVAIAGHRDSFFRPLRQIAVGDDVLLDTPRGRVRYAVTSFEVVGASDVGVLAPTEASTLTLVTCHPFGFLGPAPDRFVVRAAGAPGSSAVDALRPEPAGLSVDAAVTMIDALAAREHAAARGPSRTPGVGPDTAPDGGLALDGDAARVRAAIARFRWIYNARAAEAGHAGPLALEPCDVMVDGPDAAASCREAPRASAERAAPIWLFSLRKASGEWTMTSVTRP